MFKKRRIEEEDYIETDIRKKHQITILLFVLVVAYLFLSYFLVHFTHAFSVARRESFDQIMNNAFKNMFIHPSVILPIKPAGLIAWVIFTLFVGSMGMIQWINHKAKRHDDLDKINGEGHLQTEKDLKEYNIRRADPIGKPTSDGPNNMILSRDIKLAVDNFRTKRNLNVLVIGGSGAGKSRFFAGPNILQYNTNFVITDPSGDLLSQYGKALENNGYRVIVFNLVEMNKSTHYNPLAYIHTEKDVMLLVDTIIKNTTSQGNRGEDFWEKTEKLMLQSLIYYVWHVEPPKRQNFGTIMQMINEAEVDENDASKKSPLDNKFAKLKELDPENIAVRQYDAFKKAAGKTLKSIIISVVARMEKFMLSEVQALTAYDEMNFETFADEKTAMFVIIPTVNTTFNFLVSLLYSQLFETLYHYCETRVRYGWYAGTDPKHIYKVEQAYSQEESNDAKTRVQEWIDDIQLNKLEVIEQNKRFELWSKFRVKDKDGKPVMEQAVDAKGQAIEVSKYESKMITCRQSRELIEDVQKRILSIKTPSCFPAKQVRCPQHVRFILDEFANIGSIPEFDQKLATIRKYEISCSVIIQALSQLKKMYKDEWNTIVANCDSKLFLGCDDPETIEWLVKQLGKKTTKNMSQNFSSGNKDGSIGIQTGSRDLMTYEQITMMKDYECIVRVRGEYPHFGKKYELTNHPNYEYANSLEGEFRCKNNDIQSNTNIPLRLRLKAMEEAAATAGAKAEGGDVKEPAPEKTPTRENTKNPVDAPVSSQNPVVSVPVGTAAPASSLKERTASRTSTADLLSEVINRRNEARNRNNRTENKNMKQALSNLRENYTSSSQMSAMAESLANTLNKAAGLVKNHPNGAKPANASTVAEAYESMFKAYIPEEGVVPEYNKAT